LGETAIQLTEPTWSASLAIALPFRIRCAGDVVSRFLGKQRIFPNLDLSAANELALLTQDENGKSSYSAMPFRF